MRFECPSCHEAQVEVSGFTENAKTQLRCRLCQHEWLHGREPVAVQSELSKPLTLAQARARFPSAADLSEETRERLQSLKDAFLQDRPVPEPEVAEYWARYQRIFSAEGLPQAAPQDLKSFANTSIGAHPGNMSIFNKAWNDEGDEAAAAQLRAVLEYLLRGPAAVPVEDRLQGLIDPQGDLGMTGFRESLLTKVLCVVEPDRFLPILIYTSPAGGKREIAKAVFDLDLPAPEATSWTRGRLIFWSNDLLIELVGAGFADNQHAAQFLWWAKDQPQEVPPPTSV